VTDGTARRGDAQSDPDCSGADLMFSAERGLATSEPVARSVACDRALQAHHSRSALRLPLHANDVRK
jgi:hypothetical protein